MKGLVLDCSVTMAWCFEDEADRYADDVVEKLRAHGAVVPPIWSLEVANVLLTSERHGRLTNAKSSRFVDLLRALPITIDEESPHRALSEILLLARQQNLSSYDASYLELAMREGLPLATRDSGLRRAAEAIGVPSAGS